MLAPNSIRTETEQNTSVLPYIPFIAVNRFCYGVDEFSQQAHANIESLRDAQTWLVSQLSAYSPQRITQNRSSANVWTSKQATQAYVDYKSLEKAADRDTTKNGYKNVRKALIQQTKNLAEQTALANINHPQALQSRLLDFFSNHFSVSRQNLHVNLLCPTLEVEAIAPNLHLSFENMLIATIEHPAMLLYLNNERSMGPNSEIVQYRTSKKRKRKGGLNENLAREILELHTLGVKADYQQADVLELAKAISGWSVGNVKKQEPAGFMFRQNAHEPGPRRILNKHYTAKDKQQGINILRDLARHPATAQHISFKLAKHFTNDTPSQDLVNDMRQSWISSKGHIPTVMQTLIQHKDSWHIAQNKFKSPREFVMSACRACGVSNLQPNLFNTLELLGQGMFNAGSPAGYDDEQSAWLGSSALNARIEWANHFANTVVKSNSKNANFAPISIAQQALGPYLQSLTIKTMQRAESKQQALALFLLSPEFMRR